MLSILWSLKIRLLLVLVPQVVCKYFLVVVVEVPYIHSFHLGMMYKGGEGSFLYLKIWNQLYTVVLVCIFCRVDHIFSSQRICRSLLLQFMFMLMRGLSLGWAEYTNFLSVIISVSAFSSGKILWRIKKAMWTTISFL